MARSNLVNRATVVRALQREITATLRDDWTSLGKGGPVERDRYVQGMRDAIVIVRRIRKAGTDGEK